MNDEDNSAGSRVVVVGTCDCINAGGGASLW